MNVILSVDFNTGTNLLRKTTLERAISDARIHMAAPHATRVELYAPVRKLGVIVKRGARGTWNNTTVTPHGAGTFEHRALERMHKSLGIA